MGKPPPTTEFIAHRGESADAPENTLAAFRLAWKRGVTAIELDVHLTQDGIPVVCHDPDTERTTGVRRILRESTLAELRTLDAGRWKGSEWADEPLPTLAEVLATVPAGCRCFVEIKEGPEAVPAIARVIREAGKKPEQVAVISFHAGTVAEAKRQMPSVKAYFLAVRTSYTGDELQELIDTAVAIGADGLDLCENGFIDCNVLQRIGAACLELYVWTVDDPEAAARLIAAGVDGITSNRAAWLRGALMDR
jgi:glycerophosphoryl diester phosphodiesterase